MFVSDRPTRCVGSAHELVKGPEDAHECILHGIFGVPRLAEIQ